MLKKLQFISLFFLSLTIAILINWKQFAISQTLTVKTLVKQGAIQYQQENYTEAIASWQQALNLEETKTNIENQAIIQENLARTYKKIGDTEQEINYWQKATTNYQQLNNIKKVGRLLTEQAQAYSRIGKTQKSIAILCSKNNQIYSLICDNYTALEIARNYEDKEGEVAALGSLGEAHRLLGNYDIAISILENEALTKLENLDNKSYAASLFNSLGNVYFAQAKRWQTQANSARVRNATPTVEKFNKNAEENSQFALSNYQNALQLNRDNDNLLEKLRTLLNLIQLKQQFPNLTSINNLQEKASNLLQQIPNSSAKIYSEINLAISSPFSECPITTTLSNPQLETILQQAVESAEQLENTRVKSFALGALGHFHECNNNYKLALNNTKKAILLAEQNRKDDDILYLWEWQLGRIFESLEKIPSAINAYERAYGILESLRDDILTGNRDLQFDFRDSIEPLYRHLVQLILEDEVSLSHNSFQGFIKGLQVIDSLKLAELQNYLGDDCILTSINETGTSQISVNQISNQLNNLDQDTAIIIPMIFQERLAILLSLPHQKIRRNWVNINQSDFRKQIELFWTELESVYDISQSFKSFSQDFYDILIRPFEKDLDLEKIKTLVFILDGNLRNIPMSALYDGEQFLIEKYAIATTPSFTLTTLNSSNLTESSVLALGVGKESNIAQETYPALPNVEKELQQISVSFPNSKLLLNEDFTRPNLQQEFQATTYPIIHIATHGKFGTIPEDSFLVMGNNQKLTITDLEEDIRNFNQNYKLLELLTLTACQTAIGDDRTTLGLAGITVQAGVKSTLASLWFIGDNYAKILITNFYDNLKLGMSKAEALQKAQKNLIKQGFHAGVWSPFVLIGNWL